MLINLQHCFPVRPPASPIFMVTPSALEDFISRFTKVIVRLLSMDFWSFTLHWRLSMFPHETSKQQSKLHHSECFPLTFILTNRNIPPLALQEQTDSRAEEEKEHAAMDSRARPPYWHRMEISRPFCYRVCGPWVANSSEIELRLYCANSIDAAAESISIFVKSKSVLG